MKYEILYQGAFPIVEANLNKGEMLKAESGAMVSMSSTIDVDGKMEGGVLKGFTRMLAGEKFFFQKLAANRGNGKVLLAPSIPGSIIDVELDGSFGMKIQKDGFLASTENVEINTQVQNLAQGIFSGEGFFILGVSGRGTVFVNSYGSIHPINLDDGEEVTIDNNHLVAWPDYMHYTIEKASKGWVSSFTSGEGLVCKFRGPGTILVQTRNPRGFGSWIQQFIPTSK